MNISNIRQNIENIEYAWNKPASYLVLVPGLSLLIQKIQFANYKEGHPPEVESKFFNICRWHVRGALVKVAIAVGLLAAPLFSLLVVLSIFEGVYAFSHAFIIRVKVLEYRMRS